METTLTASTPLAERAKALIPLLDEHAAYADANCKLAPEVVDAYDEAGLFKMWVPEELGGFELGPLDSLEVLALTSYGDPSAGWVQMAGSLSIGVAGSYLGETAVKELFGEGRSPVIAGQGTAPGTATTVDGGYLLSGSWSFASGLRHGDHIHTLGIIQETGEPRIFVVPVDKAELALDSWDVMGLRGTGSIDYTLTDVFVPEDYCHFAFTREPLHGGSLYRLGIIGLAVVCHSGWASGVGRRLLDELTELVRTKRGRPGSLADSDAFRTDFAKTEARFRAAVALVRESWADVEASVDAGQAVSVRQDTLVRIALGEHHERARRCRQLRLPLGRHHRPSQIEPDRAHRPRCARRYPARHVRARHVAGRGPGADRAERGQAVGAARPRRRGATGLSR